MKIISTRALCCATLLLLTNGCTETTICIDSGSGSPNQSDNPSVDGSLITFHAAVESRNMTRSVSPVRKNIQAQIFAFDDTTTATAVAEGAYLSTTPGMLQGLQGYKMYLPNGTYNFYAVSDHTQYAAPRFVNGHSEPLFNQTDYLWWGALQQDVAAHQTAIPIVFLHCATQVIFEIVEGEGVTINRLALAHIYPPVEGAQMDLATGIIPATSTYDSSISKMSISGLQAQYTMLPVASSQPLAVSFDVLINGEVIARTYQVAVPLPDNALKAGNSYRFLVVIRGSEVTFGSVTVKAWVDVDETGAPLYPDEQ
ncbi:MAG: fimbrillin family protein [Alistipes sp.]